MVHESVSADRPVETVQRASRPPTLRTVAQLAGVSLKTASRVMNGEPNVRPQMQQRVRDAAKQLGFQPNAAATMLGRGVKTEHIALITSDIENPFSSAVAKGAESLARDRGMQLNVASSDDNPERELALVQDLVSRQVRGILLISSMQSHQDLSFVLEREIPLVFVDRAPNGLQAPSVLFDNRAAAREAVTHLILAGHRRIAFVGDYRWPSSHVDRYSGYREALAAAGLPADDSMLHENVHGMHRAREVVRELLDRPDPPTALFVANNQLSVGALYARSERGDAVAMVGFDDFDLAELAGVTVVRHDPVAMGRRAVEILFDEALLRSSHRETASTELVSRGSGEQGPATTGSS